jgi:hypothetical protein
MKSIQVSRFVLGFLFSILFAVGVQVMTPVAFSCEKQGGTNGGCKQAPTEPESTDPADPSTLGGLLNRFGIVLGVVDAMF